MAIGTLIVAIFALALGILNYFHTRKVAERSVQITTEQRKQETRDLLLQAELVMFRTEAIYTGIIGSLVESETTELRNKFEEQYNNCFRNRELVIEIRGKMEELGAPATTTTPPMLAPMIFSIKSMI